MSKNEIFASLEIADHEVRLIVGEFFDSRFYVLHTERISHSGVANKIITDTDNVVAAIKEALQKTHEELGFRIKRVLLAIPSQDIERLHKRINVYLDTASKRIRLQDIQRGLAEAIRFRPSEDVELINTGCIKYITNGITSRKMPIEEIADTFAIDIDLIYGQKEIVYAYAMCVERAGIEILDICLDAYASAQEAAIFEQAVDKNVVVVNLARHNTTLSLLTHGRLMNAEVLDSGYEEWISELMSMYHLTSNVCFRLAQQTCDILSNKNDEQVIYIFDDENNQQIVHKKDVSKIIVPKMKAWIEQINECSAPILENGEVQYLISGEGCSIPELESMLDGFKAVATIYIPQTVGARECAFITCLGLFYNWKERCLIQTNDLSSCDDQDIEPVVKIGKRRFMNDDSGFTKKLKNMLMSNNKESEESL